MRARKNSLLVSIIMPVYNVEDYLTECIGSVARQTYKGLEIVIVNDGSTDRSGEIAEQCAKNDSRIKIIHQKNAGLNMARAAGFRVATGSLIAFIDSDDILDKDFAADCVAAMSDRDIDIVIGKVYRFPDGQFDFAGNEPQCKSVVVSETERNIANLITNTSPLADTTKNLSPFNDVEMMSMWANKMFRRELIDKVDWRLSNYEISEDYPTMSQIYANLKSGILYVDKVYYYHRDARPGSITNQKLLGNNSYNGKEFPWIGYVEKVVVQSYKTMAAKSKLDFSREITLIAARLYVSGITALIERHQLTVDDWDKYIKKFFVPIISQVISAEFKKYVIDNKYLTDQQYEYIYNFAKRVFDHPELLDYLQSLANDYRNETKANQDLWREINARDTELQAIRDSRAYKLANSVGKIKHHFARKH